MEPQPPKLTASLTLPKRLLLALLLQHGALHTAQLAKMMQRSEQDIRTELEHLIRLGLVETMAGTNGSYHVRALAAPLVTFELRDQNLV